jgi:hypothetical protein
MKLVPHAGIAFGTANYAFGLNPQDHDGPDLSDETAQEPAVIG